MRLLTLDSGGETVAAIERGRERFIVRAEDGSTFADVGALLQRAADWRTLAQNANERVPDGAAVRRVVAGPGAIVCVGLNYRTHILEMGRELPPVPTYFAKFPRALTDPDTVIALPQASNSVDYEGELTVVIGAGGRDIPLERAWDAVAGLTLMNDVSMRDFQKRSIQFLAGKTWERCTPLGPVMVTADEFADFRATEVVTRVNGEQRQRAPMSELVFGVEELIADLSQIMTLHPGDLIATGTPGGVGTAMKPPRFLQHGDIVEVSMGPIGILRNRFERVA